ncbi:hypothetical protein DSLASN_35290 [Desulfoluna limicola]|uniref:YtkA-like domain-containing protein n=1 Tax=Desulfoluna limicola TaxID=2810562 RepID=A0ABM7PKV5_9BACT|nr:hypothetical protein [Desulfoluna limicola]BCS97897.1 hypothetical protein DSLASN_35290 [Desulfoluna limicola]
MKRHALIVSLLALMTVAFASLAFADHKEDKKQEMKEMQMKAEQENIAGKVIRTHNIDGLRLTYRLIDMQARMKNMEGMEKMADKVASHHMMVDVKKIGGGMVDGAKVGFMFSSPDGKEHKAMAMSMKGGHGADVDMKQRGKYKVAVKIKAGDKTVKDEFTYFAE